MCLPVLNEFGTEEQKRRFMPDNISGKTLWCQMFSEPGAGSDVASLQTRAERDGDEWVLNGQKVWTTLAHESDYGVLIARTDPEQPKHAGISMFVVDLEAPGVEIRPIHQIDGGRHFNEVFFTDVRIPADWLIGEYNNGWRQATAMLMYERVAIGSMGSGSISQPMYDTLLAAAPRGRTARRPGRPRPADADLRDGDDQVTGGDAHPRRAQGRQGTRARRIARQARQLGDRPALPRRSHSRSPARAAGVGPATTPTAARSSSR